ncbi:MAG: hypothetical protein IID33_00960, partial [Planctomycetes bacterium]|nr:hypothetical protein [Planctomycetota bacterium]
RGEDVYAGTLLLGQAANPKEGPCWAIVRPERLSVHDKGAVGLPGTAAESRRASHALFTRVELNGVEAWASDGRRRQPGTPVTLEIPERALWLLPRT